MNEKYYYFKYIILIHVIISSIFLAIYLYLFIFYIYNLLYIYIIKYYKNKKCIFIIL